MKSEEVNTMLAEMMALSACGPDLEYDDQFMALQQAVTPKPEQQFGQTIIPAESPDWNAAGRIAHALCKRTCDLRVVALLTRVWTESRGLPGYVDGLSIVDALLADRWNDVHPRLDVNGEEDPLPRMNALAMLADPAGLARSVRDAKLVDAAGVSMSIRQVEALLDNSHGEVSAESARSRDAVSLAGHRSTAETQALMETLALLQRIRQSAEHSLGQQWAPDFSRLERTLFAIRKLMPESSPPVAEVSGAQSDASAPGVATAAGNRDASAGSAPGAATGFASVQDLQIRSRDDIRILLDKMCEYLLRAEPSHPSPILLRRAQRLLDLDFFQIIDELVPEGREKLQALAGQALVPSSE